ncbi:hypothetical protein SAMN04489723_10932 [Algoriphagus aquimarinus]|uniref:Uncharacterized protein n=1 Tax=Algoriphagus aquimarinus TaxID=237018 RepID=A0A1I1AUW6_9BACT|nr:hypothetical protein [Algoriphagus aquimarinus]SFB40103.1 hypothetical protein SAMN04489723_10932 [Algoriphagus aquimarinus]
MIVVVDFLIPLHIALNLRYPEFTVGFDGVFSLFPVVAMPEGAIYKDDEFVFFEADIRVSQKEASLEFYTSLLLAIAFFMNFSGLVSFPLIRDILKERALVV